MSWDPNRLETQRLDKLTRLHDAGMPGYPTQSDRTHTTQEAKAALEANPEGETLVTVVGLSLIHI